MNRRNNIKLYDIFRKGLHLPDGKAQELIETIEDVVNEGYERTWGQVATKEFVRQEITTTKEFVKDESHATREFVKEEIFATKELVKEEIHTTREFVKDEIHAVKEFVREEIFATKGFVKDESHATREFVRQEITATKGFVKDEVNNLKESILKVDRKIDLTAAQLKNELTDSINRAFNRSTLIQVLAFVGAIMGVIGFILKK